MKNTKRWPVIFLSIFISGLLVCALLVFWIDPFFQYHKPLSWFPYQIEDQLSQNPGMARNMDYDSVILGSSITVNFSADWFNEDFDCKTLKLPYNGAYPKDFSNIMEQINLGCEDLRYAFWGIDLQSFSGEVEETKYPLPTHLYDTKIRNDYSYWWNKDVLLNYVLKPLAEREPTNLAEAYDTWELFGFNAWVMMRSYNRPEKDMEEYPEDYFDMKLQANLDANIFPIIESHPDTQFYIFFPPYSLLFWDYYKQLNLADSMLHTYEYTIEQLLKYDNVTLFYFQDEDSIICDFERYTDMIHYDREVYYYIEQCMKNGEHQITEDNYMQCIQHLRDLIHSYDFDALFDTES